MRSATTSTSTQDVGASSDGFAVRSAVPLTLAMVSACEEVLRCEPPPEPTIDARTLAGLKFSAALPDDLARATLAQRVTANADAARVAAEPLALA